MKSGKLQLYLLLFTFCSLLASQSCCYGADNLPSGNYNAPKAAQAPVIDGLGNDSCWAQAPWESISYVWLGTTPAASDFSGRYKIVWTPDCLYYLIEITDDLFAAPYTNPLVNYYNNDCVELFIDEDHSGGEHTNNYNAFAYHIQRNGNVTDNATTGQPKTFNDHISVTVTQDGTVYTWEIALKVFPDTYNENSTTNQPVALNAGRLMGFGVSYNDNDGGTARENFIGSMDIPGTDKNVAYKNASVFGDLTLLDGGSGGQLGDLNNDTLVNSIDLALMKQYLLGLTTAINTGNADLNQDTRTDSSDFAVLKRQLLE